MGHQEVEHLVRLAGAGVVHHDGVQPRADLGDTLGRAHGGGSPKSKASAQFGSA